MKITITLNNNNVKAIRPLINALNIDHIPEAQKSVVNNHAEASFERTDKNTKLELSVSDELVEFVANKLTVFAGLMNTAVSMIMDFAKSIKMLDFGNTKHYENGVLKHEYDSKGNDLVKNKKPGSKDTCDSSCDKKSDSDEKNEAELDASKIEGLDKV